MGVNLVCCGSDCSSIFRILIRSNSTQLTTPKEKEWFNKRKEAKKLIYNPDSLVNSQDVFFKVAIVSQVPVRQ